MHARYARDEPCRDLRVPARFVVACLDRRYGVVGVELAGGVVEPLSAGGVVAGAGSEAGAGEDDGSGLLVSDGVVLHAPSRATHIPSAIKPPAWSIGFFMLAFLLS